MPLGQHPRYRSILAVDVADSTSRNNGAKARMRDAMYGVVTGALVLAGVPHLDVDPLVDRGDGLLALIHPTDQVPKTLLLGSVVRLVDQLTALHNALQPADAFRLRVVLHAGEVHQDARGPFGESLDLAFRLLDAPETKHALRLAGSPLVLVVSREIYLSVVAQHYPGIDPATFTPFAAGRYRGWLHVPVPARAAGPRHRRLTRRAG